MSRKNELKKEERKRNIGLGAQVALAAAFVTMAVTSVLQYMRIGGKKLPKLLFQRLRTCRL